MGVDESETEYSGSADLMLLSPWELDKRIWGDFLDTVAESIGVCAVDWTDQGEPRAAQDDTSAVARAYDTAGRPPVILAYDSDSATVLRFAGREDTVLGVVAITPGPIDFTDEGAQGILEPGDDIFAQAQEQIDALPMDVLMHGPRDEAAVAMTTVLLPRLGEKSAHLAGEVVADHLSEFRDNVALMTDLSVLAEARRFDKPLLCVGPRSEGRTRRAVEAVVGAARLGRYFAIDTDVEYPWLRDARGLSAGVVDFVTDVLAS